MNKIKQFLHSLAFPIRYIRAIVAYNRAIQQAQDHYLQTGNRTYVIIGQNHQLLLVTRSSFRRLKRKHIINPKSTIKDLEIYSVYYTPYLNGKGEMTADEQRQKRSITLHHLSS